MTKSNKNIKKNILDKIEQFIKTNKLIVIFVFIAGMFSGLAKFTDSIKVINENVFCQGCFLTKIWNDNDNDYFVSDSNFNILILPFQAYKDNNHGKLNVELSIYNRLTEINDDNNLNIEVRIDSNQYINNSIDARKIGKKFNSDVVLWGNLYEHANDTTEVNLNYEIIGSEQSVPLKDENNIIKMASLADFTQGKLQAKAQYIICWLLILQYEGKDMFNEALKLAHQLENSTYTTKELRLTIAYYYEKLNQKEDAERYYKTCVAIDSNYSLSYYAYACFLHDSNYKLAKSYYETAIELQPDLINARYNLSSLLLDKFRDTIGALKHSEYLLAIDSSDIQILNNHAYILLDVEEYEKAINNFHRIIKLRLANADSYRGLALAYKKINNHKNAKKYFELGIRLFPKNAELNCDYGNYLETNLQIEDAKRYYQTAIKLKPELWNSHANLGALYYRQDSFPKAKKELEIAMSIFGERDNSTLLNYAATLYFMSDTVNAIEYYEKLLKIDPYNDIGLNNYADIIMNYTNDYETAKKCLLRAVEVNPNFAGGYLTLAELYAYKLKTRSKAKVYYLKAVNLNPNIKTFQRDKDFGVSM